MTEHPSEQDFPRLDAKQSSQCRQSKTQVQSLVSPLPSPPSQAGWCWGWGGGGGRRAVSIGMDALPPPATGSSLSKDNNRHSRGS